MHYKHSTLGAPHASGRCSQEEERQGRESPALDPSSTQLWALEHETPWCLHPVFHNPWPSTSFISPQFPNLTHTLTDTHKHRETHTHRYRDTQTHIHMHIDTHRHTHRLIYTYTETHAHTLLLRLTDVRLAHHHAHQQREKLRHAPESHSKH